MIEAMTQLSYGDSVSVTTETINGGEPFDATVLSVDPQTETVSVDPDNLSVVEMAIVGFGEVESFNTDTN